MRFVLHLRYAQAVSAYRRFELAHKLPVCNILQSLSIRTAGGTWRLHDGARIVADVRPDGTVIATEER